MSNYKYRAINEGQPGKLTIYDDKNNPVGEFSHDIDIGVDNEGQFFFSIKGLAFGKEVPEFAEKIITDYQFHDGEMVFNIS